MQLTGKKERKFKEELSDSEMPLVKSHSEIKLQRRRCAFDDHWSALRR